MQAALDRSRPAVAATASPAPAGSRYTSGEYLAQTGGTWFLEYSPFKAGQVVKMLRRHGLAPRSVCEIGCGAGGILATLAAELDPAAEMVGYEISPQAVELGRTTWDRPNLRLVLGDAFASPERFDLVLVMDVVEHVEDCFDFLRKARSKGEHKIYHIPLEISAAMAARDGYASRWERGHIHFFSRTSALAMLEHTGHEVLDWFYTPTAFARPAKSLRGRLGRLVRRTLPAGLCSRLFGGQGLLCLAR